MVADWHAAVDVLAADDVVGRVPVGYWGVSMGTLLGLPFVASDPRVRACVLGLAGRTGPTAERLAADAARVTVPTLFLVQLDDELFPVATVTRAVRRDRERAQAPLRLARAAPRRARGRVLALGRLPRVAPRSSCGGPVQLVEP